MNDKPMIRLALIQMACDGDTGVNLAEAERLAREAAAAGAHLIVLPELFRSPYFCQDQNPDAFDLAEPLPGPTTEALGAVARETGAWIVAPVFEKRSRGLYHNSSVLLGDDGDIHGLYRKMHIPQDPQFEEKFYFTPGDLGFRVFRTSQLNIGMLICWDQWFPEAARLCALAGADLLIYPTAIGWLPSEKATEGAAQLDAWRTIQRSHAIANNVYVAAANRVGTESGPTPDRSIEFWGRSFVSDPQGVVIAEAGGTPEVLYADLDPLRIEHVRRWWPFLRDRRTDAYPDLLRRFRDPPPAEPDTGGEAGCTR